MEGAMTPPPADAASPPPPPPDAHVPPEDVPLPPGDLSADEDVAPPPPPPAEAGAAAPTPPPEPIPAPPQEAPGAPEDPPPPVSPPAPSVTPAEEGRATPTPPAPEAPAADEEAAPEPADATATTAAAATTPPTAPTPPPDAPAEDASAPTQQQSAEDISAPSDGAAAPAEAPPAAAEAATGAADAAEPASNAEEAADEAGAEEDKSKQDKGEVAGSAAGGAKEQPKAAKVEVKEVNGGAKCSVKEVQEPAKSPKQAKAEVKEVKEVKKQDRKTPEKAKVTETASAKPADGAAAANVSRPLLSGDAEAAEVPSGGIKKLSSPQSDTKASQEAKPPLSHREVLFYGLRIQREDVMLHPVVEAVLKHLNLGKRPSDMHVTVFYVGRQAQPGKLTEEDVATMDRILKRVGEVVHIRLNHLTVVKGSSNPAAISVTICDDELAECVQNTIPHITLGHAGQAKRCNEVLESHTKQFGKTMHEPHYTSGKGQRDTPNVITFDLGSRLISGELKAYT